MNTGALMAINRVNVLLWGIFLASGMVIGFIFPPLPFQEPGAYILFAVAVSVVGMSFFISGFLERALQRLQLNAEDPKFLERFRSLAMHSLLLRLTLVESAFILTLVGMGEHAASLRIYLMVGYSALLSIHLPSVAALEQLLKRVSRQ